MVTHVRLTEASATLRASGLIYFARVRLAGRWELDGLTVRRTAAGKLVVSLPVRKDGAGREHPILRALDDGTRRELEDAVLAVARERGAL